MAVYSISDLENLTGIKAHTIRIWEKRYSILMPKRTPSNIRYYDDQDLKVIFNVALLNQKGVKISHLSKMTALDIEQQVATLHKVEMFDSYSLDAVIHSIILLDEPKFMRLMDKNLQQHGFDYTFEEIIIPLLDKLQIMWLAGSMKKVQELFTITLIKRVIISEIQKLNQQHKNTVPIRFLLFLYETEQHVLSLLYLNYIIANKGFHVVNISQIKDLNDLVDANTIFKPQFFLTFSDEEKTFVQLKQMMQTIHNMNENVPVLLLNGYQALLHQDTHEDIKMVTDLNQTKAFLDTVLQFTS